METYSHAVVQSQMSRSPFPKAIIIMIKEKEKKVNDELSITQKYLKQASVVGPGQKPRGQKPRGQKPRG